ncbi:pentatricopeptide repeat-containing protein MRL1, chloroplastic-like isoform X1 [Eucalyptus grandis]|uniref:pentatricopeptide repeat-containing protein MRL1, chloroplastic-like isoform X1 n=2 Tax=Eucalyptus grandis TaxID=71139 RepID=UPI00192ED3C4|nr:pentatricopeptide repeat-containing protein MRL1, chloroplastic-like isoform X1 [Eucalyptus grandis]
MIRIARHQQNACSIFRSGFDGIPYARALTVDWAKEIYKLMDEYKIKGTPDLYTIAINSCSQTCDWEFALSVYNDMKKKGVVPDEIFLRALIDVAGHAGRVDAAFDILEEARTCGMHLGIVSYSCLMGACSNAKSWGKALELYEDMKSIGIKPTISTMNGLINLWLFLCETLT